MGDRIRFASISGLQQGYVWLKNSWDNEGRLGTGKGLSMNAMMYDTYGDGMTQHSGVYNVGIGQGEDYLCSLAVHLVSNPQDAQCLKYGWPHLDYPTETIKFALSIKYKEGKTQYYDLANCKVSSNPNKAYDKRWNEVVDWMDGTGKGAWGILVKDFYSTLDKHVLYEAIREATGYQWSDWNNQLGIGITRHGKDAIRIIQDLVDALRLAENAKNGMECLLHNLENNKIIADQAEKIA